MFAIIEAGGKQYKVSPDVTIKVEKINADTGTEVTLDKVLSIATDEKTIFGTPYISGASIKAEVTGIGKHDKVIIHKQRPRKVYRKTNGHRQSYTALKVKDILFR